MRYYASEKLLETRHKVVFPPCCSQQLEMAQSDNRVERTAGLRIRSSDERITWELACLLYVQLTFLVERLPIRMVLLPKHHK